jgi:hypothetical protein
MLSVMTRSSQKTPDWHNVGPSRWWAPDVEEPQVQETTPKFQDVIAAARPNLSNAESQELEELVTEYRDIFVMKSDDYRRTDKVYHCIDTGEG